ncbi:MAG TPA: hypothetical protein VNY30_03990 [Bryobacteraceae bacterium]|nr:hypothetical protein [Bryobacteraceae bacterium]
MAPKSVEEGSAGGDMQPVVTFEVIATGNPVVHDGSHPGGQ